MLQEQARLQDGLNSLAPNDIEQHEGRTCRTLGTAFELRDIVRRQIQVGRKNRLTNVALLAEGFDFPACQGDRYSARDTHVPHGNFVMSGFGQKATCTHVTCGFQQFLGQPTGLCLSLFCFRLCLLCFRCHVVPRLKVPSFKACAIVSSSAFKNDATISRRVINSALSIFSRSFFAKAKRKMARSEWIPMIIRKPPLLPCPGRATRCLMI